MSEHVDTGNCWNPKKVFNCRDCGNGYLCDVCHKHDEPRGACTVCPACKACDESEVAGE